MPGLRLHAARRPLALLFSLVALAQGGCHPQPLAASPPLAPAATELPSPDAATLPPPLPLARSLGATTAARLPDEPRRQQLAFGTQLIVERDRLASSVALSLFVRAGAADEPVAGLRHLLERTLLDPSLPAGATAARLRARGSEVLSVTGPDYTVYQVVLPQASWLQGLELLAQLLDEPSPLEATTLERQRRTIDEELASGGSDGESLRRLLGTVYPGHPYQRPLLGSRDSLGGLQRDDLQRFYQRHYRPERLTLVLVGDLPEEELLAQVASRLEPALRRRASGPVPVAENAAPQPPLAAASGLRVQLTTSPTPTGELLLGFAIPAAAASDLPALELAATLLSSDGELSHEASSEARQSLLLSGREPGVLVVRSPLRPGEPAAAVEETLRSAIGAALRLGRQPLLPGELERLQRRLLAAAARRSETPAGRAQRLGAFALLGLDEAQYEQRLRSLTPSSLREILARYLTAENLTISVSAPARPALALERLRSVATSAAAEGRKPATSSAALVFGPQLYRLRSGAELVLLPDPRVKTVALAAVWPGGSRLEEERSAGLHALLARSWPRGQRTRSGAPLESALSELAASLESHVGPDSFALRAQLLSPDLVAGLSLLRDCIDHPTLNESDLERARRELLLQLGGRHGGPQQLEAEAAQSAWRLFKRSLLGGHPYALQPTAQSLSGLSRRRLLDFLQKHYGRERLVLSLVGDFEPGQVLSELEPWLGTATPQPSLQPSPLASPAPHLGSAALTTSKASDDKLLRPSQSFQFGPGQQAHLVVGFPAPGAQAVGQAGGDERLAVELLAELLLDGRLERALLQRRGLVYAVSGQLSTGLEPGYLAFYLAAPPTRIEAAEATLRDELHRFSDHPVADAELAEARARLLSRRALSGQPRLERAQKLGEALALGLPDRDLARRAEPSDYAARLQTVDAAALQTAAAQLLREEQMVRAAVLPHSLAVARRR